VDLLLGKVRERLVEQEISLEFSDDLREFLMREGYDPEFGARPLRRAIQTYVDDALADAILAGELQPGQAATLRVSDGAVRVTASGEARIQPAAQPMRAA
jgi:ATP-dependent Clp protease ATP-binding subunit ClpC